MTKYEDLCGAFRQSQIDGTAYHIRSIEFVARVLTGFVSHFGVPSGKVAFLPPEPRDPKAAYYATGAPKLQPDGWWVAYVRMTLSQGPGVYPELPILFQVRALVDTDRILVRLGDS